MSLHTGFPLTITARDVSGTTSQGAAGNVVGSGGETHQVGPGRTVVQPGGLSAACGAYAGQLGDWRRAGSWYRNFDLSLQKSIPIESKRVEFRAEFFNLTNTPHFNTPDVSVTSLTFGTNHAASQGERNIQLALKFYF